MIDTSLTGRRCRAAKEIRSHCGLTRSFAEGTIQYDLENIGRHLLSVEWDNGVTDYVYPFEIEILDEEEPLTANVNEIRRESSLELDEDGRRVVTHGDATWN
jgi:hypothetical protein